MKFFLDEPTIIWSKISCPICGHPTGPASECYAEEFVQGIPFQKKHINHPELGILPVFTEDCFFRKENLWQGEINYPVSEPLIEALRQVEGLEKIIPTKKYTFQISVGRLFSELDVKRNVNIQFRTFIKYIQSIESEIYPNPDRELVGIEFPNKQVYRVSIDTTEDMQAQQFYLQNILDAIPDTKPIFKGD